MKDFIVSALPWVVLGLSLAVFFVSNYANRVKTNRRPDDDYGSFGMVLGMSIGFALGSATGHLALGLALGMLLGFAFGMCVEKNRQTQH